MTATACGATINDMLASYLSGKTIKAMLVGSGWTFNKNTHKFKSDVTGEITGTGYTAGGIALTNVAVALDTTNSRAEISADDANFGTLTATGIAQLVTYIDTGTASTSRIIGVHTFDPQSPNGVTFTYAWNDDDGNAATPGVIGNLAY